MDFGDALKAMRAGQRARRRTWVDADPDAAAAMWMHVGIITLPDGTPMPMILADWPIANCLFACAQVDILGEDWETGD